MLKENVRSFSLLLQSLILSLHCTVQLQLQEMAGIQAQIVDLERTFQKMKSTYGLLIFSAPIRDPKSADLISVIALRATSMPLLTVASRYESEITQLRRQVESLGAVPVSLEAPRSTTAFPSPASSSVLSAMSVIPGSATGGSSAPVSGSGKPSVAPIASALPKQPPVAPPGLARFPMESAVALPKMVRTAPHLLPL